MIFKRLLSTQSKKTVCLIQGDGIGPEISKSVQKVFKEAQVPIEWDTINLNPIIDQNGKVAFKPETVNAIRTHGVALKGPLMTPIGKGHVSLNLTLRKMFGLYANVRPSKSILKHITPYSSVDNVIVRENTEGEYSGIEYSVSPDIMASVKVITRKASERIGRFAFNHAIELGRKSVTVVYHSVLNHTDGLFLNTIKDVSRDTGFRDIELVEISLGKIFQTMVQKPQSFNDTVIVTPNLYGDILSDLSAGLIGGLGLTPSGNIGVDGAIFESVHGTAPNLAGKDLANPTALLLSAIMMLRYLKYNAYADKIEKAVLKTIQDKTALTKDLGGNATNTQFTEAVCRNIN